MQCLGLVSPTLRLIIVSAREHPMGVVWMTYASSRATHESTKHVCCCRSVRFAHRMWWFLQSYASHAAYLCEIRRRDSAGRAVPMPLAAAVEVLGSWSGTYIRIFLINFALIDY